MWLIAGLGNPGDKYKLTRHNIGFLAIDSYMESIGRPPEKKEHKALTYHFRLEGQRVIAAKPQTFMNLSGESIQALQQFYKIPLKNICIIHDEVDLPFGHGKLQFDRGHGGNNGIRSIHKLLGSSQYHRIKLGVGKSADTGAHVLSPFHKTEREQLPVIFEKVFDAMEQWILGGFGKASSQFNGQLIETLSGENPAKAASNSASKVSQKNLQRNSQNKSRQNSSNRPPNSSSNLSKEISKEK